MLLLLLASRVAVFGSAHKICIRLFACHDDGDELDESPLELPNDSIGGDGAGASIRKTNFSPPPPPLMMNDATGSEALSRCEPPTK